MAYFNIFQKKKMAWNSYIGAFGSSSGAQISCSGACSSSTRACISSSGQRLQSLEAPEALSFSSGLAFSPSGATTLPHITYAWCCCSPVVVALLEITVIEKAMFYTCSFINDRILERGIWWSKYVFRWSKDWKKCWSKDSFCKRYPICSITYLSIWTIIFWTV